MQRSEFGLSIRKLYRVARALIVLIIILACLCNFANHMTVKSSALCNPFCLTVVPLCNNSWCHQSIFFVVCLFDKTENLNDVFSPSFTFIGRNGENMPLRFSVCVLVFVFTITCQVFWGFFHLKCCCHWYSYSYSSQAFTIAFNSWSWRLKML